MGRPISTVAASVTTAVFRFPYCTDEVLFYFMFICAILYIGVTNNEVMRFSLWGNGKTLMTLICGGRKAWKDVHNWRIYK